MTAYAELTSPEARRACERGDVLLLPIGAVEQHGSGLPLGTDTIRADAVARRVADRLGGRGLVLPPLSYGASPHHRTLPGTVSLPPRLQVDLIVALAEALTDGGWRKLLVINGHGGNAPALGVAQQELLVKRPEFILAWSPLTALAAEVNRSLQPAEVSGHAGESETAQLLAIAPGLVRHDELRPGATSLAELRPRARLTRDPQIKSVVTFDAYAPNGVLGDPRGVSAADGERILAAIADRLTAYAQDLLAI